MDWSTLRGALKQAVMSCTGIPTSRVFWEGAQESTGWKGPTNTADTTHKHATAELKIRQVRGYGRDERRASYSADPPASRSTMLVGTRKIVLQVKIETFRQSDGAVDAQAVAELLRTRWRSTYIKKALQAAELGTGEITPAITADFVADNRQKSCAILEIPLWASANVLDEFPNSGDWIEVVKVTTEEDSEVVVDTGDIPPNGGP